jgi:hypothetical protein
LTMESTYLQEAVPSAPEQPAAAAEPAPAPGLILLESAEDAGVCDLDGVCR